MLKTEEYGIKLLEVLKKIEDYFDTTEIRGSDVASFIFAEKGIQAIEIYQSENAVIVEFWENEAQILENEVDSYEKATEIVIDWIKINYEK